MSDNVRNSTVCAACEYDELMQKYAAVCKERDELKASIIHCGECAKADYDAMTKRYWCNGRMRKADWYCADGRKKED